MEEINNNIHDEGFDEMNQEEIEGEEYADDDEINIENNIKEEEQNNKLEEDNLIKRSMENSQNESDNINKNNLYQLDENNPEKQYLKDNQKEFKKFNNNEDFKDNENNNNFNPNIPSEKKVQGEMKMEDFGINKEKLQQLKEEIENITDSDIADSKYTPFNKNLEINNRNKNKIKYIKNLDMDSINLQAKIKYLENENNILKKSMNDLLSKNKSLKIEIIKKNDIIKSKESLNKEFQNLLSSFKDKLSQIDFHYKSFQKQIEDLKNQLKEKDKIILDYKNKNNIITNKMKNIPKYNEQIKEIQKKYEEKEKQSKEKYNEKEKILIKDFMDEINESTKNSEKIKVENEKLKYDLDNLNLEKYNLKNKISEIEYEKNDIIDKNEKEMKKLKEKITFLQKELSDRDLKIKNDLSKSDNNLKKFKNENNSLIQKINDLKQQNKEYILEIMEMKHFIEMKNNEFIQNEYVLKNKDSIIQQLRNQINEMNLEIDEKMNDLQIYEKNNQKEIGDYNNRIQELIQEKNELEIHNKELSDNLTTANGTLKEYNDIVIIRYKDLEEQLYKEKQKQKILEEKYKEKIESLKTKFNYLQKENNKLREMNLQLKKNKSQFNKNLFTNKKRLNNNNIRKNIKKKDIGDVDEHINKTMFNATLNQPFNENKFFYQSDTNFFKNSNFTQPNFFSNSRNILNRKQNLKRNNVPNNKINILYERNKQENLINEFKALLNQIDKKLEISNK